MLSGSWCKESSVGHATPPRDPLQGRPRLCDLLQGKPHLRDPLQKRMNEYSQEEVSWQTQTPDCAMMSWTNDPTPWTLTQDRNRGDIPKLKTTNQTEESKAMRTYRWKLVVLEIITWIARTISMWCHGDVQYPGASWYHDGETQVSARQWAGWRI